jgi:hypothetical protein
VNVGDLVFYYDGLNDHSCEPPGIVTKIEPWVDKAAPDRNFGVNVWVLWPDGDHIALDETELILVSEALPNETR